ncbi:chemotaxis protein CheD [Halobacillus salinarum]|uniref:Probable chemoreceptor glutamine deamidase CheD n=1 Tax=Halobacillus salinarum TaxID=2932257 RepID=A0ABY4EWD8_9BACI|nr:chemotaxis protein CheD [Halobacillus salinarum]UOQ46481.1 chemotaxis protein CheD [Halobacillus salinarum]
MTDVVQIIKVGIADAKVIKSPHVLKTSGLGSCVGIVLFDGIQKIAGMAHIMLPDSSTSRHLNINRAKFADTAVEDLVRAIETAGGRRYRLKAKLAGGAQMFQFHTENELMRIGPRNIEAVRKKLNSLSIPVVSEDVGGRSGRTIQFDSETGMLKVRTVNKGQTEI